MFQLFEVNYMAEVRVEIVTYNNNFFFLYCEHKIVEIGNEIM